MNNNWTIKTTKTVDKQAEKLNERVKLQLRFLFMDLISKGPTISDWPNYGKLHSKKGKDKRHCHLQKGKG